MGRWESSGGQRQQARTLAGVRPGGGSTGQPRRFRSSLGVDRRFLVVLIVFNYLASPRPNTIDYSNFLERVESGQIVGTLEISQTSVSGRYEDSTGDGRVQHDDPPDPARTST